MGGRSIRRAAGPIWLLASVLLACPRPGSEDTAAPIERSVHAGLDYTFACTIEGDLGVLVGLDVARGRSFSISDREVLRYWDLDSGELLAVHPGQGPSYEATRSDDGSLVALNSYRHVSVWRVADGEEALRWDGEVRRSRLSGDGQRLVVDPDRWIDVPLELPAEDGSLFFSPSFSADGRRLAVAEGYDRVHVLEPQ